MELPPAPEEMTFTDADREFYESTQTVLTVLLKTVEAINEWTDALAKRVDPDTLDRRTREGVGLIIWRAEFIEATLKATIPPVAVMQMVDYMRNQMGENGIHIREIDQEEAKRLGYL